MKKYAARVPALELAWQPPQTLTSSTDPVHKAVLAASPWYNYWRNAVLRCCLSARSIQLSAAYRAMILGAWRSKQSCDFQELLVPVINSINVCPSKDAAIVHKKNLLQSAAISRTFIHKPYQPIQCSNFIFITRYSIFTINFVPAYTECSVRVSGETTTVDMHWYQVEVAQSPSAVIDRSAWVRVPYSLGCILLVHTRRTKGICKFVHETPL